MMAIVDRENDCRYSPIVMVEQGQGEGVKEERKIHLVVLAAVHSASDHDEERRSSSKNAFFRKLYVMHEGARHLSETNPFGVGLYNNAY